MAMSIQEVRSILQAAVEASVYIAPRDPGLSHNELVEIARRHGLRDGEINDALARSSQQLTLGPNQRVTLTPHLWQLSAILTYGEDPDLRNPDAFDFVATQLNHVAREMGAAQARLDRNVLLERANAASISRHEVEVAMTLMVIGGLVAERDGVLAFRSGHNGQLQIPSATRGQVPRNYKTRRTQVMPDVRDVIARRDDGRPRKAEPLAAFADELDKLGYGHFRLWWNQVVGELGRTDPALSPLSVLVLSAALVEGALTFVVKHARSLNLGVFGSNDFNNPPTAWRIDSLVSGAAHGGNAILGHQTRTRADILIRTRQRIHAGRMLVDSPNGLPDFRPEEARDAKAVAELIVRQILDWLEKHRQS